MWILLLLAMTALGADEILLWPNGAPGSVGKTGEPAVRLANGERVVSNIHKPVLIPYLPGATPASGAAVIVIPGGGHRELWSDHEGHNVAKWLAARGVAGFVLLHRLAREKDSTYRIEVGRWPIPSKRFACCAAGPRNGSLIRTGSASWGFRRVANWRLWLPCAMRARKQRCCGRRFRL